MVTGNRSDRRASKTHDRRRAYATGDTVFFEKALRNTEENNADFQELTAMHRNLVKDGIRASIRTLNGPSPFTPDAPVDQVPSKETQPESDIPDSKF